MMLVGEKGSPVYIANSFGSPSRSIYIGRLKDEVSRTLRLGALYSGQQPTALYQSSLFKAKIGRQNGDLKIFLVSME